MNTKQHPHSALRTGHGGAVPGRGKGDKVNAKYEPGEFVVSNDMLDAAPGLAEQLHDLRGEVLAKKGMTTAQADAKATAHSELRANTGGAYKYAWTGAQKAADTGGYQYDYTKQAQAEMNAANRAANAAKQMNAAGGIPARSLDEHFIPEKPGKSMLGKIAGSADEWSKYGGDLYKKAAKVGSAVYKPVATLAKGAARIAPGVGAVIGAVEGADAYKRGDKSDMAWAAGDIAASAALMTPAAPLAIAYGTARAAYEGGKYLHDSYNQRNLANSVEMPKVEALQRPSQAAPGQPTPTQDANPYADKNAAMIAAANAANPDLAPKAATAGSITLRDGSIMDSEKWKKINAPGELGASRAHGNDGQLLDPSQEQVYTGDKLGWQTRTSEHGLQLREQKNAEYQALQDKNYAEATRGGGVFQRQLQSMRDEKDATYLDNVRQNAEFGNVKAKAEYEKLTAAKALRDDTRATRENASLVSRQAEERLNQTARRDENTLRRNERAEVFKTAVEGRKAEVEGKRLKLDEENALQAKSKEGFSQRQTELEKQFPDDPVGQKEFMQFSDNYRKEAARAVEKTDPERAKKILNQDHVLEADDRAKIQDAWDLRAATKKHAGKWYGSGKDTDSLNPADYAVTGVDKSNVFGGGKVTLRNGSNVPINDLNDQGWFGGPGSSRFVPMIKKAREEQAKLDAQKAAQVAAR